MIEEYKDYCVLKAFDLTNGQIEKIKSLVDTDGVFLEISSLYKDSTIILINKNESEVKFNEVLNMILSELKGFIYADNEMSLEECVVKKAIEKSVKIGVAESLTGGMVCSSIVNVSGSSVVLHEGLVTYATTAKVRRLHVKTSTLDKYGPASKETCKEMVQGVLENKEIKLALATTGCAGPNSDEFDTPVGLAYIGVGDNKDIIVKEVMIDGNRETVRKTVTNIALYMLLNYIEKLN